MGASDLTGDPFEALGSGPAHRFADYLSLAADVPRSPGVYIWDWPGLGLRRRGWAQPARPPGARRTSAMPRERATSGDQFCVYIADHDVLPTLNREQVEAIRDGRPSFDALVRDRVGSMAFRFVQADDYAAALAIELAVKTGALPAGRPRAEPCALEGTFVAGWPLSS